MTTDAHLTTDELSQRWKGLVSPKTLVNWRSAGRGPKWIKLGKGVAYRLSDVEAWERDNTITPE